MTVNAAARPNKLIVAGLEFPGFSSYTCAESGLDTSGCVYATGTIEIQDHHANPQSLNDRLNRWWCWGKKIEVLILGSDNIYKQHPRGMLYLLRSFYDSQEQRLTLEVGCLLSLLKGRSVDDYREDNKQPKETKSTITEQQDGFTESTAVIVISYDSPGSISGSSSPSPSPSPSPAPTPTPAPTGDLTLPKIFRDFQKNKFYNIQDVVAFLLGRAGVTKIYGSVSGQIRGPISFTGSLIQQAGDLCFKASPPSYIWADKDVARITSINIINNPAALLVIVGVDEVSYKPLDSGLEAISQLVVTGNIDKKNTEKPDGDTEVTNPDGSKEKTSIAQDFGPETVINFNGNPTTQILLSTTTTTERIQPNTKIVTTVRVERRGLVVPNSKINRGTFVEGFRSILTQYFSTNPADNGRLNYEEETIREPVCKVFGGFFNTYGDVNFTFPTGFETLGNQTFPADSWLLNTTQVLSSRTRTDYTYDGKGVLLSKNAVTQQYVSAILTTYWPFVGALAPSKQTTERWMRWGDNEMHRVTAKTTYQERFGAEVDALDEKLWKDKVAGGTTETTAIPTYTRTGDVETGSSITYSTRNINTFQVKQETRMSLVTEKDGDKIELSRSGLANAPATEYLPAYSSAGQPGEAADDWEEDEIKIDKYWHFDFDCSGFFPPKEFSSIGKVPDQGVLSQIADILYFYRQGKSKAHELTVALDDWWLSGQYRPVFVAQIVEFGENAITYLISGLNFSCEPDANLVLADAWWVGASANSIIGGTQANWLQSSTNITVDSVLFEVGDRVEVSGFGAIPGVPAGRYWVSSTQIVAGKQQVQVSSTLNGTAITVTGAISGQPRITAVRSVEPELAFAQLKPWLQTNAKNWVELSLDNWLVLEVI